MLNTARRPFLLAAVAAALLATPAVAQTPSFSTTVRNQAFDPAEITVPAGQKFELQVTNADAAPIEFESKSLRREKIVPPGKTVTISIGPLKPGRYEFEDEFHPKARGHLIAK